jgi:hypothetical protein
MNYKHTKYLISIPSGGYKCCAGIGLVFEIKKIIDTVRGNISYAGVSSGVIIAFIMCHNSSNTYKLKVIKAIIQLETSNDNVFIQLDKIREIFKKMLLPNKNDYLQFNDRLHIGLMFNFKFTIISNFYSNDNLLDIIIASITLFPLSYDMYQWIDIYQNSNKCIKGIAFDGAYSQTYIKPNNAFNKYINYTFDYNEIGITNEYFLNKKNYNLYKKLFLFGQQYVKNNYNTIKKKLKLT